MRGPLLALAAAVALVCATSAAALTPNDPTWSKAWGQRLVEMPKAWDITTGDPNIIIGVIDTGVSTNIADLQGQLVPGWDFVDNDAVPQDTFGHGTLTTSELVARGNNGKGITGYCWRCRVMPVRVNASGSNFDPTITATGIRWAVDHGARVLSLGFNDEGMFPSDPQVAAAISYASQRNVLVIASSGNSSQPNPTHPASDPGAYGVAGTDPSDLLYSWSTYGAWVPVAAPGCQIMMMQGDPGSEHCGNSTSTPAVAGIAALLLSYKPSLNPAQVMSALEATSTPIAGIGGGRVDAYRALQAIGAGPPPPPPPLPPPPVQAPPRPPRKPAPPKVATHVQRGLLRKHRAVWINVARGRVAATLKSTKAKAKTCTVSLSSDSDVWLSAEHRPGAVSLTAKVPTGRYKVDVWCGSPRASKFSLSLRATFV
jgi:subtilisin family serine protease